MIRRRRNQGPAVAAATGPTAVFIACHELVVAIATEEIDRLYVASELESRAVGDDGALVVSTPDGSIPGWDLGEIVIGRPVHDTWVVVKTRVEGVARRFALRAGRCLAVRPLPPTQPLAPHVLDASLGVAIAEAFAARELAGLETWACGVIIAPRELLDADRRARSERLSAERIVEW